jgi:hypothetical protein
LRQAQIKLLLLDAATEHFAIKTPHLRNVRRPNDDVIDLANVDFHVERP